ncbi:MAG: carboxypeptidase regulatory-like domain-containing protein [Acidobacteriota bacterium]
MRKIVAPVVLVVLAVVVGIVGTPDVCAQAVVTGVVRDVSGAVLPGVTVEAASSVLIEKVRSAVSDGGGQYRIIDLRPGDYSVTFSLTGFSSVKREGIVLAGTATAVVNADLKVGSVEETVTVSGAAPLVDVQGVAAEHSVTRELLESVPTGRTMHNVATLIPGIIVQGGGANPSVSDVGGSSLSFSPQASIHGGTPTDQRLLMEGLPISATGGSNTTNFIINIASIQELTVDTAGVSAEDNSGGVRMNIVPREGGNQFHTTFFADGAGPALQSANFTDALAARGYPTPNPLKPMVKSYTINPAVGGPLRKDALWFYVAANRMHNVDHRGIYPNKNAGDPNAWLYVPDPNGTFPTLDILFYGANARLTWQATSKNKFAVYYDEQGRCGCPDFLASVSPEAQPGAVYPLNRFASASYTAPITNRLVVDISGLYRHEYNKRTGAYPLDPSMIGVTDSGTGITYRAFSSQESSATRARNDDVRGAVSFVTGAHALKAGFQAEVASNTVQNTAGTQNVTYRFTNGVPSSITLFVDPRQSQTLANELGLFAQDRWTVKRLTLTGGLRYDYYRSSFPDQTLGPVMFAPTRNITFPASDGVKWNDITTRMGAAYDVFGNGKTAVKVALNKYLSAMNTGTPGTSTYSFGYPLNPINRVAPSTTRSWTDSNKNFVPDCNLLNPGLNGECGALANQSFGQPIASTNYDPGLLTGWGKRLYNWEFLVGVQQQVLPRVSVDVSYIRRSYGNSIVTDNLAVAPSDYTQFSIVAPVDSRLPGGGGQTISGLLDINPNKFGQTNNVVELASNYADLIRRWQGVDVGATVRAMSGLTLQGGLSTGSTFQDACAIRAALPEWTASAVTPFAAAGPTNPYCSFTTNWLTHVKGMGTYNVPKVDVQVSLAFQSMPGPVIAANFNASSALALPSLGRPLSGNVANVPVNLVPPGTLYGERMNDVDLRLGKTFRIGGRARLNAHMDLFNLFNVSTVIIQNDAYSPTTTSWQTPQTVIAGRLVKLGGQFDF